MNKIILFTVSLAFSLFSRAQSGFESFPSWFDNFAGKGFPDTEKWNVSDYFSTQHFAYYCRNTKNVNLKNGKLNLTIRKDSIKQYTYTSGRIVSKRTFQCGKIEFRVKCPVVKGVWNAIWLISKSNDRRICFGELDILESIGCWGKMKYQINPHLWGTFGGKANNHKAYAHFVHIDISKWHIYTLEWYEDRMVMSVDKKMIYQVNKNSLEEWPFNQPYNLVFALAYGGSWAGACGLSDDKLPQTMKVDWVKYYPLKK